jgi:1-acyl-sn-glycerol-3-phosphate acyltransferase
MVRTLLYLAYFWLLLIVGLILFPPYLLLRLLRLRGLWRPYVIAVAGAWGRHLLWMAGARVEVTGRENLPAHDRICFVSNHQSYMDILLITGYIPKTIGYITKKELGRLPVFNLWMKASGCIFIDRHDLRQSLAALERGVENIGNGWPMLVFPEGTRSRGPRMGGFHPGSLRLAERSGATIVPLTVDGTYRMYEEGRRIRGGRISLVIHPPLEAAFQNRKRTELAEVLRRIIAPGGGQP